MVSDLKIPVDIEILPTVREKSGLAMSSRNKRLNEAEKTKALVIYEALSFLKTNIFEINIPALKEACEIKLTTEGFNVDYVELTDDLLNPITNSDRKQTIVALIAASIGEVRLIDNMIVNIGNHIE